jgi:hypothetical protein
MARRRACVVPSHAALCVRTTSNFCQTCSQVCARAAGSPVCGCVAARAYAATGFFIEHTAESVLLDKSGKELMCEALYLLGVMCVRRRSRPHVLGARTRALTARRCPQRRYLFLDIKLPGPVRERLFIAHLRIKVFYFCTACCCCVCAACCVVVRRLFVCRASRTAKRAMLPARCAVHIGRVGAGKCRGGLAPRALDWVRAGEAPGVVGVRPC